MQYCNHCNVNIKDNRDKCVLCGNTLPINEGDGGYEQNTFPAIPPFYASNIALKIMIFISIAAVVVSFAINMIFPSSINWPLLFLFGLLSVWIGLYVILKKCIIYQKRLSCRLL